MGNYASAAYTMLYGRVAGGVTLGQGANADFMNNIVWSNNEGVGGQYLCLPPAICNVTNSTFEEDQPAGAGNSSASCLDQTHKILPGSLCVDSGVDVDTVLDLTGGPRRKGNGVDRGAYEVR